MAEQQEPIYINYGNDAQIEQNAFLNAVANNVLNYVSRLSWSNKRKELFMKAYSDIMQKGVIGADNSSGIWNIKHNGTIDLDSLSKKEREMYGEAAYYIQLQMSGLPTKLQQLEAINNEKLKLPLFDNKYFTEQFQGYIGNQEFGGRNWSKLSDWNILDEANKNGIRRTLNRANKLADMLQGYLGSLKEGEYNFEGTPFTDLNDFKTRVQTAIDTLRSGNSSEYRNVLNRIGLNVDDYLSTGENDIIGLDDNGNPVTRNQYIQMLEEQNRLLEEQNKLLLFEEAKKKQAEKDEVIKQQAANLYLRVNRLKSKGTDVSNLAKKYKNDLKLLQKLIDLSVKNDRTPDEIEDIVGAYKFYNLQGKLENLSPDEIRRFKYLPSFKNISPNTLKKLKGIDNVYFDTRDNRVVIGIKDKTQSQQNEDLLELQNKQLQNPRQLSEGLLYEDYARLGAALGDVISLGGFWANVGGSIVSLLGDTTADIADDKISTWEAVKNFGRNLGWTAAGFIPGGKLGKVAEHMLRWGPKLMVALNNYNLLTDESNKKTWNKLTSDKLVKEGLNDEDLKNITYWIRALTGTANATKATARDIKYSKARGTAGQEFTTKDGTKVNLSNKDVQEINAIGARKGLKAAEEAFKSKTGKEVVDNSFKFSENGRTGLFKNTRSKLLDLLLLGKSTVFRTPEQQRYYDLLQLDRNIGGYSGWKPFWQRGTSSYFDHFNNGFSFRNPLRGIGLRLDPYRNIVSSETPKTTSQNSTNVNLNSVRTLEGPTPEQYRQLQVGRINPAVKNSSELPENVKFNRETMNNYKNMINGNFSNNELQSGSYNLTGTPLLVVKLSDGTFSVLFKGNVIANERNLKEIQKTIRNLIKNTVLQGKSNSSSKISAKEMGRLLKEFKAKGWLKQGGTIDKQKIQRYKEFILK